MPLVSVHIVTYNSAHVIEACVDALFKQDKVDFSLTVIDNASTDATVQRLGRLEIPVTVNPTNIGYAAAHNQAIDQTDSAYVLTLNPDVQLQPNFLYHLSEALECDERIGSGSGCLLRVDALGGSPSCIDSAGLFMQRDRRQRLRCEGFQLDKCPEQPRLIFGPDGAAAFYRRAMLDDIRVLGEVFDPDFFIHKEDVDVCWRAQLRGWGSVYVPTAHAYHIRSFRPGKRRHMAPDLRMMAVRNRYLMMLKNEIALHFWRDLWAIVPYDLAILAYLLIREPASLRAYASLGKLWRRMIRKRRLIQSSRAVGWREIETSFGYKQA